jgi:hypothetical protein
LNVAVVATLTKPLLLAALALGLIAFAAPFLLERAPDLRGAVELVGEREGDGSQSAAQLSTVEFERVDSSFTPGKLRSFAGEPATKSSAKVEGVALECWYYGVGGARGAYQICFENGRLSTKVRYGSG